jgi:hypothetical protein
MEVSFSDIFVHPLQDADPAQALIKSIEKNEEKILDLNRRQLDRGLDAEGKSLGRYKNFNYKRRFEPVDLKLTGSFRDKMNLQVTKTETTVFSQDQKEAKLQKQYGKEIEGIPLSMIANMQDIILDDFVEGYQALLLITTQTERA